MSNSSSSTSINNLADLSLARIFHFVPPDERVRAERVCRKWGQVAKKYAWSEFRTLRLDVELEEMTEEEIDKAKIKFRALLERCSPYLRQLRIPANGEFNVEVEQWARMRNLRHLRFDACVSSETLRAAANNLKRLQSIDLNGIEWRGVARLHDLLRNNNASLQALRLPLFDSRDDPFCLPTLPCSLRSLHLSDGPPSDDKMPQKRDRIDELLELAASCCPQLTMLMLPMHLDINRKSLTKLARFEQLLFYLRFRFNPFDANILVFGDTVAKIGEQLRALSLNYTDSRVLNLIAKHCPLLEHCLFGLFYCLNPEELLSALRSVFQLEHLRSLSIIYNPNINLRTQILATLSELIAKGKLENLLLSICLSLSAAFITNLLKVNPKLRKLTCEISNDHTSTELYELKTLLQNMDRPLEVELFSYRPIELEMVENDKVRIGYVLPEFIDQAMLRQFWAQAMDSVPDLGKLDDFV